MQKQIVLFPDALSTKELKHLKSNSGRPEGGNLYEDLTSGLRCGIRLAALQENQITPWKSLEIHLAGDIQIINVVGGLMLFVYELIRYQRFFCMSRPYRSRHGIVPVRSPPGDLASFASEEGVFFMATPSMPRPTVPI
jgi:hypothetical protein